MRQKELHPLTIKINHKQKQKAKQSRHEALLWLAKTFPHAFDATTSIHPLKTGIMLDILKHADMAASLNISKTKLREAVIVFTRKIDYLTCLKAREMRIDLYGHPTVAVTEEEAEQAAAKIKKQIEKNIQMAKQDTSTQSTTSLKSNTTINDAIGSLDDLDFDHRYAKIATPAQSGSVIIKHKSSKAYDPDAVARLKEKLGLSRQPCVPS